jgi:hypothetical protein
LVGPKDFSAKFQIGDTYGNAIFEVDLSRKTLRKILDVEKPNGLTFIITFTKPGRILRWDGKNLDILFVSEDISGGERLYTPSWKRVKF